MTRKILQIAVSSGEEADILYALCSDHSVWSIVGPRGGVWKRLPPIPQEPTLPPVAQLRSAA